MCVYVCMRVYNGKISYRLKQILSHTTVEMKSTLEGLEGFPSHTVVEMKSPD